MDLEKVDWIFSLCCWKEDFHLEDVIDGYDEVQEDKQLLHRYQITCFDSTTVIR
jgi:hypothetical protein